jgi:hypothetical protein
MIADFPSFSRHDNSIGKPLMSVALSALNGNAMCLGPAPE